MSEMNTFPKNIARKKSLFTLLYKNVIIIILATLLGLLIGFGIGVLREKPIYTESTSVMLLAEVNQEDTDNSETGNIALSKVWLPDVEKILESNDFANTVNAVYKKNGCVGEIVASNIDVAINDESLIFSISYTDIDQELAGKKLNAVVAEAKQYLNGKIQASNVELKETANVNDKSVKYDYKKYLIIGAIAGLLVAVGVYAIKYLLDNTVKDKAEIEELTGVNVFACIETAKYDSKDSKPID